VTPLFDTHFHLDLQDDPRAVAARIEEAGIYTVAVTNAPSVFQATVDLVSGSKYLRPSLGLHPELVVTHDHELPLLEKYFSLTRYVGEVGLDYTMTDEDIRKRQRHVFGRVLELAAGYPDRILTVHSRRADKDVIEMVGSSCPAQVILHWYSGSERNLGTAIDNGLWISVNPAMVRSKRFLSMLTTLPRDRILLETDGPFVQVGRRDAIPSDVGLVVTALADSWSVDVAEARQVLWDNFSLLLRA
jgi:TatD DNase family protein